MAFTKKLPPFQNVAANTTAVISRLPVNWVYEKIRLVLGGTAFTKANISAIRLMLLGKKIWEISGTHLDTINKYYKQTANAAYLDINFANPSAKDAIGYFAGALDTSENSGYGDQFSLEIDIGAATAPTLAAWAQLSAPSNVIKGTQFAHMFRTLTKTIFTAGGAGEFSFNVPVGSPMGAYIRGVHAFHTNVTQLQVVKDAFYLLEAGAVADVQFDQNVLTRTTQSGLFSWDPCIENYEQDAVLTTSRPGQLATWDFKFTVSGADTPTVYSDLLRPYNAI